MTENDADAADIRDELAFLWSSYSDELLSQVRRLDNLIGDRHWLSVGTYKEVLVRNQLKRTLPGKYEIGTGFVLCGDRDRSSGKIRKLISKQLDILVWDKSNNFPVFRVDDFALISPQPLAAVIEVKGRLTSDSLAEAFQNLDSLSQFSGFLEHERSPLTSVFAFDSEDDIFPYGILNQLWTLYSNHQLKERLSWVRQPSRQNWSFPWINHIVVLNKGVIRLERWRINEMDLPVYVAYATIHGEHNDSYGFLERDLLMNLRFGDNRHLFSLYLGDLPLLAFTRARLHKSPNYMVISDSPIDISKIGRLKGSKLRAFRKARHMPRKPRETEIIGEHIKDIRKKLGYTLKNMAEHIGVSPSTISKWIRKGHCPVRIRNSKQREAVLRLRRKAYHT